MKKSVQIFLGVLLVMVCGTLGLVRGVSGSGVLKTEKRNLPTFTAIESNGSFEVEIVCQQAQNLEIEADDNLLPLISTEVKNGTLVIQSKKHFSTRSPLKIRISVPDVTKIELAGSGDMSLSDVKNESLEIELTGSGDIHASGISKKTVLSLTGSGDIDTKGLQSELSKVEILGSGDITVSPKQSLEAEIMGSGNVTYFGDPQDVKKEITGSGRIIKKTN